jgi:hypothetical protein
MCIERYPHVLFSFHYFDHYIKSKKRTKKEEKIKKEKKREKIIREETKEQKKTGKQEKRIEEGNTFCFKDYMYIRYQELCEISTCLKTLKGIYIENFGELFM